MKKLKVKDKDGNILGEVPASHLSNPSKLKTSLSQIGFDLKRKDQNKLTFQQAHCFAQVASDIYKQHLNKNINNINPTYLAPYIVNATFSIELFLKSIRQAHSTTSYSNIANKHNLKELYFSLPGKIQNSIVQSVSTCLVAEDRPSNDIVLKSKIKDISNAFVEWRYMHEKKYLHFNSLRDLITIMNALYNSYIDIEWYKKTEYYDI